MKTFKANYVRDTSFCDALANNYDKIFMKICWKFSWTPLQNLVQRGRVASQGLVWLILFLTFKGGEASCQFR